jgi:hypothetical protein
MDTINPEWFKQQKKPTSNLFGFTSSFNTPPRDNKKPVAESTSNKYEPVDLGKSLEETLVDLMELDIAKDLRPLAPLDAFKREIIIKGYNKDFKFFADQFKLLNDTQSEKDRRLAEIKLDFKNKIDGINQMTPEYLDKIILLMKQTRTDFAELEKQVRASSSIFTIFCTNSL